MGFVPTETTMPETLAKPFQRLSPAERRVLLVPATYLAVLINLIIAAQFFSPELDRFHQIASLVLGVAGIVYTGLLYRFFYSHLERTAWLHWGVALINGLGLGLLSAFDLDGAGILVDTLAIMAVFVSAILSGRWLTYAFVALLTGTYFALTRTMIYADFHMWMHLLGIPLTSIVISETVLRLGDAITAKVRRLETINTFSRQIAATIEIDQVISLLKTTVQEAIRADSYYVGLIHGESLQLELFYDDGEFFPSQEIPLEGGLAGWVLERRKSLLLSDLPRQVEEMGLDVRILGKPRPSLSWIGAPMVAGNHLMGIIAMGAYQRNAYRETDLELLESMAHQAALAIDSANHHAEVTRQSQLDSLTQVYNHSNLLAQLEQLTCQAAKNGTPLSLIMLDVDFFKQYNDTYGHLVGDQALNQVVEAVRKNIRSHDILGRWGGEEFTLILPETTGSQAMQVAERIRQTLRILTVPLADERRIPVPTISQGIAMFAETGEALKLVDLADKRLYIAKDRGRDQVEPDGSYWEISRSQ
jgi:diguanylate cyclase (GGDEF)-like protein